MSTARTAVHFVCARTHTDTHAHTYSQAGLARLAAAAHDARIHKGCAQCMADYSPNIALCECGREAYCGSNCKERHRAVHSLLCKDPEIVFPWE